MRDILDELRNHFNPTSGIRSATSDLVKRAAEEIERLRGVAQATPEPSAMTERLIQAAVDYEQAQGMYAAGARRELSEARAAIEAALALTSTMPLPAAPKPVSFLEAMNIVERGFDTWKDKPHNAKWYSRIDGTPIPNDLKVNIAEAICHSTVTFTNHSGEE